MTALEVAVEKLDGIRIAVQNGRMHKGSDLHDLSAKDRGEILDARLKEDMEDFIDCAGQIGEINKCAIMEMIYDGQNESARKWLLMYMADTPLAYDILAKMQERAEQYIHEREVSNRYESNRLHGAVVYYLK